ncbi:MAG TPA: RHS repeat-associated core domain-containing protein [Candidatus Kapabacteria bacterium]|nr:RHS repeat-associated core domain-containing protein [Candidatus Kapabacteria bacterium]
MEDWYYRYSPGGERDQKRLYAAASPDSVTPYGWVYYVLGARSQLAVYHGQQVSGAAGCGGTGRRVSIYPAEYLTNGIGWNGVREQITQVVTKPSGVKEYQISDHLASLRVAIEGTAERHIDYTPWGNVLGGTSGGAVTGERQTYNNQEPDGETGLYDLSDRKMDPETGRFVSPDRLMEKFPSVSPYSYCANNPVRLTDPTGMQVPEADGDECDEEDRVEDASEGILNNTTNRPLPINTRTNIGMPGETPFPEAEPMPPTPTNFVPPEPRSESEEYGPRLGPFARILRAVTSSSSGLEDEPGIPSNDLDASEEAGSPGGDPFSGENDGIAKAPVEKFSDYIFKEGATHGKAAVFENLGYSGENSAELAKIWEEQAAAKYSEGDFTLGKLDQYGQRINIVIQVRGIGNASGQTSSMISGWMIRPDGTITLNTPFSGYAK